MSDSQPVKFCPCGRPLHYSDFAIADIAEELVTAKGETIEIQVMHAAGAKVYHVPRHYIFLHGVKAAELPALAERYGFRVTAADVKAD